MQDASRATFGKDAMYIGTGGSIPFIGMLGEKFPEHAVPHDGRPRAALERARPERVPAPPHGQASNRLRVAGAG